MLVLVSVESHSRPDYNTICVGLRSVVRARQICSISGCSNVRPCSLHNPKNVNTHTEDQRQFYTHSSSGWRRRSEEHRKNEPLCREHLKKGLIVRGQLTDHIIPIDEGGDRFDESNLQTLCWACHQVKTARETHEESNSTQVTVVNGPPASGKNFYVAQHFLKGDLIVDIDLIFQALSGLSLYEHPEELLPFVAEARDAILARLHRTSKIKRAWIITTQKNVQSLANHLNAKIVTISASKEECLNRLQDDLKRTDKAKQKFLIEQWFNSAS